MHRWGIISFRERELGSIWTVIDIFVVGEGPFTRLSFDLGEVNVVRTRFKSFVIGAGI